jgi:hypothetical protein
MAHILKDFLKNYIIGCNKLPILLWEIQRKFTSPYTLFPDLAKSSYVWLPTHPSALQIWKKINGSNTHLVLCNDKNCMHNHMGYQTTTIKLPWYSQFAWGCWDWAFNKGGYACKCNNKLWNLPLFFFWIIGATIASPLLFQLCFKLVNHLISHCK